MCKCFVGLCHLVHFITFADGIALALVSFKYFSGKSFFHGDAFTGIGKINEPTESKGKLAIRRDFQGNLVSCATDPASFDLEARFGVIYRTLQDFQRIGGWVLGNDLVESAVNDALGHTSFSTDHDGANQSCN